MKKTKIICTMGPNSDDREVMKQLVLNGMDVARFNFSHGNHEEHKKDISSSVRWRRKQGSRWRRCWTPRARRSVLAF